MDTTSNVIQLRTDGLSWQTLDDEVIVLDLHGSRYLKLNGTAATLWRLLTEPRERTDMVNALLEQYDVDETQARRDVAAFLEDLRARGLVQG